MDSQGQGEKFTTVTEPGSGGLHTVLDPQDIADVEMSDCRNVIFTGGYVTPRQGFVQTFAKPAGETGTPNILARGTTSDGVDLMIAVYGTNFYLWDPINSQTILLNTGQALNSYSSVPGANGYQKFWSYETWLGGIGTDVMYFANGVDTTTKWQMSLGYVSLDAGASDKQLIFPYPNRFNTNVSASLIAMLGGVSTVLSASSTSNVLSMVPNGSVSSFTLASANSNNTVPTIAANTYGIVMNVQPSNGDTFTFTINGTAITTTAVSAIGASAGNFLIAGTIDATFLNLYNLLTNPNTTNANQVALSPTNAALVNQVAFSTFNYNAVYFSSGVGQIVPAGTAVTSQIGQTSAVPVCSILKALQTRLWAVGGKGTESRISWSQTITPENFTTFHTNNTDPGTTVWGEGHGGITGIADGGGFIYFLKADMLSQGQFIYSQDASTTYLFSLVEFASGVDVGVSNFKRYLKNASNLDYMTNNNGVTGLQTSSQSSVGSTTNQGSSVSFSLLSEKINDRLQKPTSIYFFDYTTAFYWSQKGFWSVSTAANTPNSLLLMYDYLYQYWTVFDGWNVQDMVDFNNQMYFLANTDGSVNQCFTGYQDGSAPYTSYYVTKRFDLGEAANTKTSDNAFVQGLITQGTTLNIDALFNENGSLGKQTYSVMGTNSAYIVGIPQVGALGQNALGTAILGAGQQFITQNPSYYRVYPQLNPAFQWHNLSFKFYSDQIGSNWAVDKLGILAELENAHPNTLDLAPA